MDCRNCTVSGTIWSKFLSDELDNLGPEKCRTEYDTMIQSRRKSVLLVTDNASFDNTFSGSNKSMYELWSYDSSASLATMFGKDSSSGNWGVWKDNVWSVHPNNETWGDRSKSLSWPVRYCLSEPAAQGCRLQISIPIAVVVTLINFG